MTLLNANKQLNLLNIKDVNKLSPQVLAETIDMKVGGRARRKIN